MAAMVSFTGTKHVRTILAILDSQRISLHQVPRHFIHVGTKYFGITGPS